MLLDNSSVKTVYLIIESLIPDDLNVVVRDESDFTDDLGFDSLTMFELG